MYTKTAQRSSFVQNLNNRLMYNSFAIYVENGAFRLIPCYIRTIILLHIDELQCITDN